MSSGPGKGSSGQLKKQLRKTSPAQLAQTSRIRMKETPKSYITWKSEGNMVLTIRAERYFNMLWMRSGRKLWERTHYIEMGLTQAVTRNKSVTGRLRKRCICTSLIAAIATTTGPPTGKACSCIADDCHQRFSSRTISLESQQELPCTLETGLPLLYPPYANSAMKHLWFRTTKWSTKAAQVTISSVPLLLFASSEQCSKPTTCDNHTD